MAKVLGAGLRNGDQPGGNSVIEGRDGGPGASTGNRETYRFNVSLEVRSVTNWIR